MLWVVAWFYRTAVQQYQVSVQQYIVSYPGSYPRDRRIPGIGGDTAAPVFYLTVCTLRYRDDDDDELYRTSHTVARVLTRQYVYGESRKSINVNFVIVFLFVP